MHASKLGLRMIEGGEDTGVCVWRWRGGGERDISATQEEERGDGGGAAGEDPDPASLPGSRACTWSPNYPL